MKILRLILVVLAIAVISTPAGAETDLVLDIRPGTLVLSQETGDFEALGPHPTLNIREVEEAGELSSIPNVKIGVGISKPRSFTDLTGHLGVLVNERFRALMLGGDVSFEYRFRKNVAMGPHIGLSYFADPEWSGDATIEMDDSWGVLAGLQISIGYDILFVFNMDYLYAKPFDMSAQPPWVLSDDEMEITGLAVQFGIRGRL